MRKTILLFSLVTFFVSSAISQTTVTIQPDAATGKDAFIQWSSSDPSWANGNYGNYGSFEAVAWTWNGVPGLVRGLLQFDLSVIPSGAIITDARLSLYNDPLSSEYNGQHASLSGSNVSVLQRITSNWSENTVTWNNQPPTTTQNQVILPQSISAHQDYPNIDVLPIINDMIQNPGSSFGFVIKLQTEQYYRSMIFASSDNVVPAKRPKLEITYLTCSTLPPVPNAIAVSGGLPKVCPGDTRTYTTNLINGVTYNWTLPTGANFNSGQGTNSISVTYDNNFTANGIISVVSGNNCGNSNPRNRNVNRNLPAIPCHFEGPSCVLSNSTGNAYSISSIPNATSYTWTGPIGSHITGNGITSVANILTTTATNVTVDFGALGFGNTLQVQANNSCGSSAIRSKTLVTCLRPTLNLERHGDLASTDKTIIYPNPTKSTLNILLGKQETNSNYQIIVRNLLGKEMLRETFQTDMGLKEYQLNLQQLNAGVYFLVLRSQEKEETIKFTKE